MSCGLSLASSPLAPGAPFGQSSSVLGSAAFALTATANQRTATGQRFFIVNIVGPHWVLQRRLGIHAPMLTSRSWLLNSGCFGRTLAARCPSCLSSHSVLVFSIAGVRRVDPQIAPGRCRRLSRASLGSTPALSHGLCHRLRRGFCADPRAVSGPPQV